MKFSIFRYQSVLMRARFDEKRDIKDPREAKKIYLEGCAEFDKYAHPYPIR